MLEPQGVGWWSLRCVQRRNNKKKLGILTEKLKLVPKNTMPLISSSLVIASPFSSILFTPIQCLGVERVEEGAQVWLHTTVCDFCSSGSNTLTQTYTQAKHNIRKIKINKSFFKEVKPLNT